MKLENLYDSQIVALTIEVIEEGQKKNVKLHRKLSVERVKGKFFCFYWLCHSLPNLEKILHVVTK